MSNNDQMEYLKLLSSKIDNLDGKIDRLDSRLDSVDRTLVSQAADLKYHIKRTDLLEQYTKEQEESVSLRLAPLEEQYKTVSVALKVIGGIATIALTAFGIFEALQKLSTYL